MVPVKESIEQLLHEQIYVCLAVVALLLGLGSVSATAVGSWPVAFYSYLTAVVCRLAAGYTMNRMGDAVVVNAWNDKYHRFVVIVLNAVVGVVLLGRLTWDVFILHAHIGSLAFLACVFVAYFIAARFTAPNTFGARVRSATLTVVLIYVMTDIATGPFSNPWLYVVWVQIWPVMWSASWDHLRALQRRFGWADR